MGSLILQSSSIICCIKTPSYLTEVIGQINIGHLILIPFPLTQLPKNINERHRQIHGLILLMVDHTEEEPDKLRQVHLLARLGEDPLEAVDFAAIEVVQ